MIFLKTFGLLLMSWSGFWLTLAFLTREVAMAGAAWFRAITILSGIAAFGVVGAYLYSLP